MHWDEFEFDGTSGERADAAITTHLRRRPGLAELSRTRVHALIEQGGVNINGMALPEPQKKLRPGMRVGVDMELLAQLLAPPAAGIQPVDIPLTFHYSDEWLAVVDKPAGLSVHPGAGEPGPTLAGALLHHFGQLSDQGGVDRPGIVHRLDKETTGLLVVARDNLTHAALARQFAARTVEKEYAALCLEAPEPSRGVIALPIARHPRDRKLMWTGGRDETGGRAAVTDYELREWWGPFALLALCIHSGRTHQIRVHLQSLAVSILEDEKYGAGRNRALRNFLKGRVAPQWQQAWRDAFPEPAQRAELLALLQGYPGIFLHARRLALEHPATGERLEWESPLPEVWQRVKMASGTEPVEPARSGP